MARYDFASDNTAGAAPEALDALVAANAGFASGYGTDDTSRQAADAVRALLDVDAEVRFVANGTAANSVALAALAQPHEGVLAHRHAHILTDETGAPGLFGGGVGLLPLDGDHGRIDPAALDAALAQPDVSYRQGPAALSLTNATEFGTTYRLEQLRALTERARDAGLGVHLDGARIANAAAAGLDLKALARLPLDVLILGGTKSGMTPSEAMVVLNPRLARRLDARLKHAGQLTSKGRFVSAPWLGMLAGEGAARPWLAHAGHANAMASRLAEKLSPRFPLMHPVEANGVFVRMDAPSLAALHARGWFVYRFLDGSVRFMCGWATTPAAVDEIAEAALSC